MRPVNLFAPGIRGHQEFRHGGRGSGHLQGDGVQAHLPVQRLVPDERQCAGRRDAGAQAREGTGADAGDDGIDVRTRDAGACQELPDPGRQDFRMAAGVLGDEGIHHGFQGFIGNECGAGDGGSVYGQDQHQLFPPVSAVSRTSGTSAQRGP